MKEKTMIPPRNAPMARPDRHRQTGDGDGHDTTGANADTGADADANADADADLARLVAVRARVLGAMMAADFAGADPFDGLESRWIAPFVPQDRHRGGTMAAGFGRLVRLAWVQGIKRGPRWLRRLAMIRPLQNPKTLALLAGAAGGIAVQDAQVLAVRLVAMQNADGGWGYPFAWQARAFFARRGQSNVIATSFVVDALCESGRGADDPVLRRAASFLSGALWRDGYFAYLADDDSEIHNASLWAAWALWRITPDQDQSRIALWRVIGAQKPDGSWPYGTRPHHGFVDGFHTGYVLDLLDRFARAGIAGAGDEGMAEDMAAAITRGLAFYMEQCFDPVGRPRGFAGRDGYIDAHGVAQAIATYARFGRMDRARALAGWAVSHLYDDRRGVFYAGIGRWGRNRQNYLRWTQSWMVWALAIVIERPQMEHSHNQDAGAVLTFDHPDPDRAEKEAVLRALDETAFRALFARTRQQAAKMRQNGDMLALYPLTRGLKTLQRIGGERGIMLAARRLEAPDGQGDGEGEGRGQGAGIGQGKDSTADK